MARTVRSSRGRNRRPAKGTKKASKSNKVRIKGHSRSPRGPDRGKSSVRVKGHRRGAPR